MPISRQNMIEENLYLKTKEEVVVVAEDSVLMNKCSATFNRAVVEDNGVLTSISRIHFRILFNEFSNII